MSRVRTVRGAVRAGRRPVRTWALLGAAATLALSGCTDTTPSSDPTPTKKPTPQAVPLELGVVGTDVEIAEYREMVKEYNASTTAAKVSVVAWPTTAQAHEAVVAGDVPDVFVSSRGDLADLIAGEKVVPVGELLDERGVDFGDKFARDAVEAFGSDAKLQCMPYSVSPQVVFYNTDLIDFDKMRERGLNVPSKLDRWTWNQFSTAAQVATKPRRKIAGFHVDADLRGIAPFVHSAGGKLFDDEDNPTALAFSDSETVEALEKVLPVLRDPRLTLSPERLEKASAVEWFKRGKLGMVVGNRSLVPELRATEGLNFDVIAIPYVEKAATIGDLTGLCMSAATKDRNAAADLMASLVSDESVARIAELGYMMPANVSVSGSEVVQQPDQMPEHSEVFASTVRFMAIPPLLNVWEELQAAVDSLVADLLTAEPLLDLEETTAAIDEASRAILDPDGDGEAEDPTEPSETPGSGSPTAEPSTS